MAKRNQRNAIGSLTGDTDLAEMVFKRNQVDATLGALSFSNFLEIKRKEWNAFKRRITRLLEIDRAWGKENKHRLHEVGMVFHDRLPEGQGVDVQYSLFHTFTLAIALEMLNAGFKQKEVVDALGVIRNELDRMFQRLMLETHSNAISPGATDAVFLVAKSVEVTALMARRSALKRGETFIRPKIVYGWDDLTQHLKSQLPKHDRSVFLIELAELATKIMKWLPKQSIRKRGPQ